MKIKLTQQEGIFIRKSVMILSFIALCVAVVEDLSSFDQSKDRHSAAAPPGISLRATKPAVPDPVASPAPFIPYELNSHKHEEFMAEEQREMEERRQGKE